MTLSLVASAVVIFLLRIVDVSLGTLRIAMMVRGHRALAGALGFAESLIWLIAAARVLSSLESPIQFVAYAGGFAAGTMLGTTIEKWLAIGKVLMRIIEPVGETSAVPALRNAGYYATVLNAEGRDGTVKIVFTVIPRRRTQRVLDLVAEANPRAFVTLEQTTPARLASPAAANMRK